MAAPAIVTLEPEPYIPWFLWVTVITLPPLVVDKGLPGNLLAGIASLTNVKVFDAVLNEHLFNLNFKSLDCSGVHVEAFCELKNTPP